MVSEKSIIRVSRKSRMEIIGRGFSLVEILVVVGVLAILLLLMIGGFSKANAVSLSTRCLANLRASGAAISLFASENQGVIVLNVYGSGMKPSTRRWGDYVLGTASNSWDGKNNYRIDYTNGNRDAALCPAEAPQKFTSTGFTYGALFQPDENDPYTFRDLSLIDSTVLIGSATIHAVRLSTMDDPANYWLLGDSYTNSSLYQSQIYLIRIKNANDSAKVHLRHNGKANLLFADGSVRSLGPNELKNLKYNPIRHGFNEKHENITF